MNGSQLFVGPGFAAPLSVDGDHIDNTSAANDLMNALLAPSIRKLPSTLDVQILNAVRQAAAASASGSQTTPVRAAGYRTSGLIGTAAVSIVNGGFDVADPAATDFGWAAAGSAEVNQGELVIAENPQILSRMSQSFSIPAGTTALQFTITGANLTPNSLGPPDAFEVALLDSATGGSLARCSRSPVSRSRSRCR